MRKRATDCAAALAFFAAASACAGPLITERINVNPTTGVQADGPSDSPALSADGCIVAFVSQSGTLAPASYGLTASSVAQVYAVNRCLTPHTIELVSVTNDGSTAADRACFYPNISADGRYVAFVTSAGNLPISGSGPSGQVFLVFVRDRITQTTLSPLQAWRTTPNNGASIYFDTYGSVAHQNYMSADASEFAFEFFDGVSAANNVDAFHVSGATTTLQPVCPAAAATASLRCSRPQISGDGSTIVFATSYPILVSDVNAKADVYSYNTATTNSAIVSITAASASANNDVDPGNDLNVSNDGHLAAFSSDTATNFPGNTTYTLLVKSMTSGQVTLISAAPDGTPERPNIFGEGGVVPQLSADGNRVAFDSNNNALPPFALFTGSSDALVADIALNRLGSTCLSASGAHGDNGCDTVTISADGKWAAFRSLSDNLVPNDTNNLADIFVIALDPAVDNVFASGFEL